MGAVLFVVKWDQEVGTDNVITELQSALHPDRPPVLDEQRFFLPEYIFTRSSRGQLYADVRDLGASFYLAVFSFFLGLICSLSLYVVSTFNYFDMGNTIKCS